MIHCCPAVRNSAPTRRFLLSFAAILMLALLPVRPASVFGQSTAKTARKVVVRVEPNYPDFFRNGHFESRIVAAATVLPSGSVSNVEIKAGNPMLANFAAKALMKWKYAPGPDKTIEEVIFNFTTTPR